MCPAAPAPWSAKRSRGDGDPELPTLKARGPLAERAGVLKLPHRQEAVYPELSVPGDLVQAHQQVAEGAAGLLQGTAADGHRLIHALDNLRHDLTGLLRGPWCWRRAGGRWPARRLRLRFLACNSSGCPDGLIARLLCGWLLSQGSRGPGCSCSHKHHRSPWPSDRQGHGLLACGHLRNWLRRWLGGLWRWLHGSGRGARCALQGQGQAPDVGEVAQKLVQVPGASVRAGGRTGRGLALVSLGPLGSGCDGQEPRVQAASHAFPACAC
mmetsp:Transcript_26791/g.85069  ORF Transcript_26791/g.85069 Transcript_26791/m.85069 type:complete len:268 (+) Transcript_26791:38-841(+)